MNKLAPGKASERQAHVIGHVVGYSVKYVNHKNEWKSVAFTTQEEAAAFVVEYLETPTAEEA